MHLQTPCSMSDRLNQNLFLTDMMNMLLWLAIKGKVTSNSQLLQGLLTYNSNIRKVAQ